MIVTSVIFILHAGLLILAMTNFSILGALEGQRLTVEYFRLRWASGLGHSLGDLYELPQIGAYVAAYLTGVIFFGRLAPRGVGEFAFVGVAICGLGCLSFLFEGLNHFFTFPVSATFSLPIAVMAFWLLCFAKLAWLKKRGGLDLLRGFSEE